jgi:hypothetical protein
MHESADLTEVAKKSLGDLLDSYQKRETALQCEEKEVSVSSKVLLKKTESEARGLLEAAKTECFRIGEEKQSWEEEKKNIARTYHFENNEIKLDIGGQHFTTTLTTLRRFPDTMIGAMFSGRHDLKKNEAGAYFIDRDWTHFRHILNFLRSPERFQLNLENDFAKELEIEAEFYGLADRMFGLLPTEQDRMFNHSPTISVKDRMFILSPANPVQDRMFILSPANHVQDRMFKLSPANPAQDRMFKLSPANPVKEVQFDSLYRSFYTFDGGSDVFLGENPISRRTKENPTSRETRENAAVPVQEVQSDFLNGSFYAFNRGTDVFAGENPISRENSIFREKPISRETRENASFNGLFHKGGRGRGYGRGFQGRGKEGNRMNFFDRGC